MRSARYLLIAIGLGAGQAAVASDFSANIGFMSDYFFRGIKQSESSAYGGLDWEAGGFYAGTWLADVEQGLEYDLYAGYGGSIGDFSWGIGGTGYFYTDDFDDTYLEANFSLGWNWFTVDYAYGEYDNFDGPTLDYDFLSFTGEYNGFYATYGTFGKDFDGDYVEAGYGTEVSGIELGVAAIWSDDTLAGGDSETSLVFTIGKTFDL
ncbi:MAG: TorF family putative porin [Gammaproteobacteria bacterium]